MFNLFCCWSLLLWNSLQRTFSLLTQDWISWYWPNKSVTSVTILKILYLWEEFQDFWIWRQWLLSLCLGVHTWRRGGEISLFTALIRYLSRRCFWPSNGYQRLKWGFALFIILFFFFFSKDALFWWRLRNDKVANLVTIATKISVRNTQRSTPLFTSCCMFIHQGDTGFGKPNCRIETLEWESMLSLFHVSPTCYLTCWR